MSENKKRIPLNEENLGAVSGGVDVPGWAEEEVDGSMICMKCAAMGVSGIRGRVVSIDILVDTVDTKTGLFYFDCPAGHTWEKKIRWVNG